MPYSEKDASIFFGREDERKIIAANLRASRLTLLYGASGVGKSSVLRAGVVHHLRQLSQQNLIKYKTPEFAVVVFPNPEGDGRLVGKGGETWRDDPLIGLTNCIQDSIKQTLNVDALEPIPQSKSLAENLHAYTQRLGGYLLIILDQFEEYFLYPHEDDEGAFAVEFPDAVNHPELRVHFLISIRDDALAKLDYFKGRIPKLFGNYLRVEHLSRKGAREAIEEPITRYNLLYAAKSQQIGIEPELVNAVLDQITSIQTDQTGHTVGSEGADATSTINRIKAPYLQLVMARLWDEERWVNSQTLRLETLNKLGGVKSISETHLNERMNALTADEQDIAARVLDYLVTPSGNKKTESVSDLAHWSKLSEAQVIPVLNKLCDPAFRILRPVAPPPNQPNELRYETFHDALAKPILDWQAHYESEKKISKLNKQLTAAWEQTKRWRTFFGLIVSFILLIFLFGGIAYWQDWWEVRSKYLAAQARSKHLKLYGRTLDPFISDTALLYEYKTLLKTDSSYMDTTTIINVKAMLASLEESIARFGRQLTIKASDTLTIVQQLESWKKFADSRRASPERDSANAEVHRINEVITNFASIKADSNFVTCRLVVNREPKGIADRFLSGTNVWVLARNNVPADSEKVTFKWYARRQSIHIATYTVKKGERYRVYSAKYYGIEQHGQNEVRLYNSQNILIGRRVFYVGR